MYFWNSGNVDAKKRAIVERMKIDSATSDVLNMAEPELLQNGCSQDTGQSITKTKTKKGKTKKVSFNVGFDEVEEIPRRDEFLEIAENGESVESNGVANGVKTHKKVSFDVVDDVEKEIPDPIVEKAVPKEDNNNKQDINSSENEIEFLRRFANLRKLGEVMKERSTRQADAEREHMESQLARARQILQKQSRRQELASLIPGEELERLLNAVHMQEEHIIQRDDSRKFMLSTRKGKTSFIYLAGTTAQDVEEDVGPQVQVTESSDSYSQTFGDIQHAGLL